MADPDDPESLPTPLQNRFADTPGSPPRKLSNSAIEGLLAARDPNAPSGWQPPSPEELQHDFPQYEIRGILGRGGMGAVYKAWQKNLDRFVAIKILPSVLGGDGAGFAERFKREAKAMAQLKHPGIVAVYDAGTTPGGLLYFIMECVGGTDLRRLSSERGRLEPGEALRIASAVCDALSYAHEHGVIHRDIKPANIMLDAHGVVKVADFGLAKSTAPGTTMLTVGNATMGTPEFMAPEAMKGAANVDHRADLYAVGVMLYQMLTGELPRGRFLPLSRAVPGLDKRLDAIVDRALQSDPTARFSSAIELRTAIVPVLAGAAAKRSGAARELTSKKLALIAATVLVMFAALVHFALWKTRASDRGVPAVVPQAFVPEPTAIPLWRSAEEISEGQGVRWEDNALRLDARAVRYTTVTSRDAIVRAAMRMNPDGVSVQMGLRYRPAESGDSFYLVQVNARESIAILSSDLFAKRTKLHTWPLPRSYRSDEWLRIELRAIGDEITVIADGQTLGTVRDSSLPQPGGVHFFAATAGFFRDIVYVPLDKTANTTSPAR